MPGLNFAFHCETPINADYKSLFRCRDIETAIKECQKREKKILISLGGAVGNVGFKSEIDAQLFAYRVYHLFLEGSDLTSLRPFGRYIRSFKYLVIKRINKTKYFVSRFSQKHHFMSFLRVFSINKLFISIS